MVPTGPDPTPRPRASEPMRSIDPGVYYQAARVSTADGRQFTVEDGPVEIEPSPISSV